MFPPHPVLYSQSPAACGTTHSHPRQGFQRPAGCWRKAGLACGLWVKPRALRQTEVRTDCQTHSGNEGLGWGAPKRVADWEAEPARQSFSEMGNRKPRPCYKTSLSNGKRTPKVQPWNCACLYLVPICEMGMLNCPCLTGMLWGLGEFVHARSLRTMPRTK